MLLQYSVFIEQIVAIFHASKLEKIHTDVRMGYDANNFR